MVEGAKTLGFFVTEVKTGSNAELADVVVGMEVVSINDEAVESKSKKDCKQMLKAAGSSVALVVKAAKASKTQFKAFEAHKAAKAERRSNSLAPPPPLTAADGDGEVFNGFGGSDEAGAGGTAGAGDGDDDDGDYLEVGGSTTEAGGAVVVVVPTATQDEQQTEPEAAQPEPEPQPQPQPAAADHAEESAAGDSSGPSLDSSAKPAHKEQGEGEIGAAEKANDVEKAEAGAP